MIVILLIGVRNLGGLIFIIVLSCYIYETDYLCKVCIDYLLCFFQRQIPLKLYQ